MKIKPVGYRLLIKPLKTEERTKSGIYIPESAKEQRKQAEIIELGNRINGKWLQKGDKIIFGGYSHEEIEIDNEKFIIIELKDILAKVEE